jgi:hypothetical protein
MIGSRSTHRSLWLISGGVLIIVVALLTLSHRLGYLSPSLVRPVPGSFVDQSWSFDTQRDANNYGLTSEQCDGAFPGLFDEIDRVVRQRQRKHITEAELTRARWPAGTVRVLIWEQQVCSVAFSALSSSRHRHMLLSTYSIDIRPRCS